MAQVKRNETLPSSMLTVSKILELYKGSSFPTRIQASDGNTYILKMKGAGNGVRSLLQEFLVNRVSHLMGCHVPNAHSILIPDQFPWTLGTDEFDDLVKKDFWNEFSFRIYR